MRRLVILVSLLAAPAFLFAQEYEWVLSNTGSSVGERVVAVLDAGDIGTYEDVGLVGQVIDNNGNWGYAAPTVANFSLYVRFSQKLSYNIIQDRKTANITLRLRKISDSRVHLTAYCPIAHRSMIVSFKKGIGSVDVSLGSSSVIDSNGDLLVSEPAYQTVLSGSVGIGTSINQDEDLAVNGKIKAKEIKVETGWSDFVFEADYRLRPLAEVEQFIEENKHLPDIPSAKEVETNGVNVGEMEAKLLQKIEELTLYVIELKKQNEEQANRLERLENERLKSSQRDPLAPSRALQGPSRGKSARVFPF